MMLAAVVALVVLAVLLPHVLPLHRADPPGAILLWAANLGLRALLGVFTMVWLVLYLPATQLFRALTHWCWHAVVPLLTTHLGLDGHRIGDAAVVLPALVFAASVLSVGFGVWRVARAVRGLITRTEIGRGPRDSVILGGADVLVAAAGIGRPKVVVSAGALTQLDDEELAAALDHERAHIARLHRFALLYAEACRALGRFVPGTRRAVRELAFQLERDADRWALRSNDRYALASAILKAAQGPQLALAPAAAPLAGTGQLEERLGALIEDRQPSPRSRRALRMAGACALALVVGLAASVPSAVATGLSVKAAPPGHACPS